MMKKITVLGGGSFGTVVANIIANNGYRTVLWMRDREQVNKLNEHHENSNYLPGFKLHEGLLANNDLQESVQDADMIFVAVPSTVFRMVVQQIKPFINGRATLITLTKGIEAETFKLMSQILHEEIDNVRVAALSGPNLAKEIVTQSPTGAVIASKDSELRHQVQDVLRSSSFRVYANDDILGVELGGALKNIYAIIAGIADSIGMGHNTNAMLVTRSLTEMARFGVKLGADPMTFLGLSGVGDLIVTCSSPLSRNFRVGKALGEGKTVDEIVKELGQVAEGLNTLVQVKEKSKELDVGMPLVQGLYDIIHNDASADHIISSLMLEEQGLDVEFEVGNIKNLSNLRAS